MPSLITLLFFTMIRPFLVTVLMAAIIAGLCYPATARLAESRLWRRLGLGKGWAATVTILAVLVVIVVPMAFLLGIVITYQGGVQLRAGGL